MSTTFDCEQVIRGCDCLDSPIENFSSETEDAPAFIGLKYFKGDPPLGTIYQQLGCLAWCYNESQEAADDCALQQAQTCAWDGSGGLGGQWQMPVPGNGYSQILVIPSAEQACSIPCEDGASFLFILPAGSIISANLPHDADARAYALACKLGNQFSFCPGELDAMCMQDAGFNPAFSLQLEVTTYPDGLQWPVTFALLSGSLPTGLSISPDGLISGTLMEAGNFNAVILATDSSAQFQLSAVFMLQILNIPTTLPDPAAGVAYSQTLTAEGFDGLVTWTVTVGALPEGLTLDANTGVISGTPTSSGEVAAFTIQASSPD